MDFDGKRKRAYANLAIAALTSGVMVEADQVIEPAPTGPELKAGGFCSACHRRFKTEDAFDRHVASYHATQVQQGEIE